MTELSAPLPAAVLWDMDGTLVDTEPAWIASEVDLVKTHGNGTWTKQDGLHLVGQALPRVAKILQERGGVRLETAEILENMMARVEHALQNDVEWLPGAYEILQELGQAEVPYALVTMSYRRLACHVLPRAPEPGFATSIAGDEVSAGKPDPEPYVKAAAALGVPIEQCVAVEDSIPGVASARASGARVLAVQHFVEIPAAPGLSRTDSLTRISLADLGRIGAGEVLDHLA